MSCEIISPNITRANFLILGWSSTSIGTAWNWEVNAHRTIIVNESWHATTHSGNFEYIGQEEKIILPMGGYQFEAWGAEGQADIPNNHAGAGNGGYVSGKIVLQKSETIYVYVGEKPIASNINFTFNGGGPGELRGGGGTDFRLISGSWNNIQSLASRIIVAGGGGSGIRLPTSSGSVGHGGGLFGIDVSYGCSSAGILGGTGGSQTVGGLPQGLPIYSETVFQGEFGQGGYGTWYENRRSSGGGGGYYGGGFGRHYGSGFCGGGGGSSFISGHIGAVAISSENDITPKLGCTTGTTDIACSIHYSNKVFTDTIMIDGSGYSWSNVKNVYLTAMPNPIGGNYPLGEGHSGNGYARITKIN